MTLLHPCRRIQQTETTTAAEPQGPGSPGLSHAGGEPVPCTFIATLGTEPQVVTLALQSLVALAEPIAEVVVVHTAPHDPRIIEAVAVLERAFASEERLAQWRGRLRLVEIAGAAGPLPDMVAEEDFGTVLAALYKEVRDSKQAGSRVHLNLAGGRKVMSLCGAIVAQLLFDQGDRLWYLQSAPDLVASRSLFAEDPAQVTLVPLPVLRWSPAPPILTDVALAADPVAAISAQRGRLDAATRHFLLGELTPAEREVVRLALRTGATDAELARLLYKSPRTVSHQLSVVYSKLRVFLGVRDDVRVDRHTLMAAFSGVEEWDADERR
jgi:CRISPR-associated protein Csx14